MLLKKIERLCKEAGISIAKLERSLDFGNATIRGWEKSDPRAKSLKAVADYFGVSMEELLSEEGDDAETEEN